MGCRKKNEETNQNDNTEKDLGGSFTWNDGTISPREAMSFRIVVNHVRAANSDEDADSKLPPPHREPGEHFSKFTKIDAKHER